MSIPRPTGGYAGQMLEPGGWPQIDETTLYDRARQFTQTLNQLTQVLESWQQQQAQVFEGGIWTGGAADAANGEVGASIDALTTLQNGIATVITWHNHTAGTIEQTKSAIIDNVEVAHQQITTLDNDPGLDADARDAAINAVIAATYGANVSIVAGTAEQMLATKSWTPPDNALQDLLDRKTPPPYAPPDGIVVPGTPPGATPPAATPAPAPAPDEQSPQPPSDTPPADAVEPSRPGLPPAGIHPPVAPPGGVIGSPGLGVPPAAVLPPNSPLPSPGAPGSAPGSPTRPDGAPVIPDKVRPSSPDAPDTGPAAPLSPAASTPHPAGAGGPDGKGVAPASVTSAAVASASRDDTAAPGAPAAASASGPAAATPMSSAPASASAGTAGAARGASGGSAAPVHAKPLGPPPTPKPAAPVEQAPARSAPTTRPERPDRIQAPDVAAMAAVPVSAALAARDAIAAASAADAARRRGPDPLRLARRIAAALNAPDSGGRDDLGFFWITAVTRGGAIVVANSYGLAYIPDGVQLPEPVHVASADETIPATERARWATYPLIAVQGWAVHHDSPLRAVIATEQQFADSDPGAAKVVLQPDDIPDSGDMAGRSRLEVVDPEAAEQLSGTSERDLTGLLPVLPTNVDPSDPDDRRAQLWFEVLKPMMSRATGRETAHLRAFHGFAAHSQEVVAAAAHAATHPDARRAAVADWLYWKHLTALCDDALATTP